MIQAEDSLNSILATLNMAGNDSIKDKLNIDFSNALEQTLLLPSADNHVFKSLKSLVQLTSSDHKFRIFHWNLPDIRGEHRYYGFLKVCGTEQGKVFKLTDRSDSMPNPDTTITDNRRWFGALYYKIIREVLASGEPVYTLLGWAGHDKSLTMKVIEVLTFDNLDHPHFGLKVFPDYGDGKQARVIYRFGSTSTMSMKYEKQAIETEKKWNGKKQVFDYTYKEAEMIVCDRLVPLDPQLEGQYRFYVAAGDVCDGFLFRDHHWHFISGIDPWNKK
jgi:hypothetical protein